VSNSNIDAAWHLIANEQQITAPHGPGAPAPLPPVVGARWLTAYFRRVAPGLATTAVWGLAAAWHQQLAADSTEPLWLMGTLSALSGLVGLIAAAKQHGSSATMTSAFGATAVFALVGVAAWTPHWPVSVLMWLLGAVAAYGLCIPHWRTDRQEQAQHERTVELEKVRGFNEFRTTATKAAAAVEVAQAIQNAETAKVQAIVAASDARTRDALLARELRGIAPGDELDVKALLRAAGHGPAELPPGHEDVAPAIDDDLEALLRATEDGPREPSAAERAWGHHQ
jgi:hypothetical protein